MKILFFIVNAVAVMLVASVAIWFTQFDTKIMAIGCIALFVISILYVVTFGAVLSRWLDE